MVKTVCDFCGKEMETTFFPSIKDYKFAISTHGRCLDICGDCRTSLNEWINSRKASGEGNKE